MSKKQRNIYYRSYTQTYIQRDVRDMAGVFDEIKFHNFITAAAARTGQLLNCADLARDVAVDSKTAKSWLSVLRAAGLVYLLQPWHSNLTKRLIKSPKLYFPGHGSGKLSHKMDRSGNFSRRRHVREPVGNLVFFRRF